MKTSRIPGVSAETMTQDHVYDLVLRAVGIKRPKLHAPMALLQPLIRLCDKLLPEPPATPGLSDLLTKDILAENNAAGTLLGRRGKGVVDAGP